MKRRVTDYHNDPDILRAAHEGLELPEPEHAEQVSAIALGLFDSLLATLGLKDSLRPLLAAGALWHDIGYRSSGKHHHRDSATFIMSTDFTAYSGTERTAIAQIARYHRGPEPDIDHRIFSSMQRDLRDDVEKLAGILRLAEAMDTGHESRLVEFVITVEPPFTYLELYGSPFLADEAEMIAVRSALFERRTSTSIRVATITEQ